MDDHEISSDKKVIAEEIALLSRRSFDGNLPILLIVQYEDEIDKKRLLHFLKKYLHDQGIPTQNFDPLQNPEHGLGRLYPKMIDAAQKGLMCIIEGLPLSPLSNGSNDIKLSDRFLEYFNLHRDRISRERIRIVLFLHSLHAQQFIHSAGDLWDFRQHTYWLERSEIINHEYIYD